MSARRRLTRFEKIAIPVALLAGALAFVVVALGVELGYLYWIGVR